MLPLNYEAHAGPHGARGAPVGHCSFRSCGAALSGLRREVLVSTKRRQQRGAMYARESLRPTGPTRGIVCFLPQRERNGPSPPIDFDKSLI
jgi:hypothetical protein